MKQLTVQSRPSHKSSFLALPGELRNEVWHGNLLAT
jgi:hypothetical protein